VHLIYRKKRMETASETLNTPDAAAAERFVRVELPWNGVSPARWLALFPEYRRWYWKNRDGSTEVAGVDPLFEVSFRWDQVEEAFAAIRARIPAHPDAGCFGTIRFQPDFGKPAGQFVFPRWECHRSGSRQVLVMHGPAQTYPEDLLEQLRALADRCPTDLPEAKESRKILYREDVPDRKMWFGLTRQILSAIEEGSLLKAVPARRTTLTLSEPIDPAVVVEQLKTQYPSGAYVFCAAVSDGRYFVGASPERLFTRVDSMVGTEAIAGTAPRGNTPEEDTRTGQHLLASRKNRAEHELVVRYITEQLESLGITAMKEKTRLLTLPVCHHLLTTVMGNVPDYVTDAQLLMLLHPTPAVAGYPREAALTWLAAHEPFDREWYAGPVGRIGWHSTEFCVGIRSAVIDGNRVHAYTGAGIVSHSQPADEWRELEIKLRTILDAVTAETHDNTNS